MTTPAPTALPVLMYHGLHADADSAGRYDRVYSVRPDHFAEQLDWLRDHGYRTLLPGANDVEPLYSDSSGVARTVMITFDDGDVSNAEVALPLLRARDMAATFFITSDFINQPGMLDDAGLRALANAGMTIGGHGRSHLFLEDLQSSELDAELRDSRARLAALSGQAVEALALPGGRGDARERAAALAAGYHYLFGSVPGINRPPDGGGWLQRIAVTREMTLDTFADLVTWRGWRPRLARARYGALRLPKRVLGNARYQRLRDRLL